MNSAARFSARSGSAAGNSTISPAGSPEYSTPSQDSRRSLSRSQSSAARAGASHRRTR
ncbi:hypothetical protein ACFQY7_02530 [Actinomadura luteofluorescens]|uniref:hypothetical protein n=1 Tax=Actinomadura luteofluorescens TaxID=46163 RepID=UPI00363F56E0